MTAIDPRLDLPPINNGEMVRMRLVVFVDYFSILLRSFEALGTRISEFRGFAVVVGHAEDFDRSCLEMIRSHMHTLVSNEC